MKQISFFIFLAFTTFNSYSQDLRITEIMYNPGNPDSAWEWVEVYNAGTEIINLEGYVLDDNSGAEYEEANILSGTVLSGESAIIFNASAITEEEFLQIWGTVDLISASRWSALNNGGDSIAIWNSLESYSGDSSAQENAIEKITYAATGVWPIDDGSASIYLIDIDADRNDGNNWLLSSDGDVTPLFKAYTSTQIEPDGDVDVGSPGLFGMIDLEKPIIVCPNSVKMISETGVCEAQVTIILPTATDNVSTQFEFQGFRNDGLQLSDNFPVGETTITWTAIDEAGNLSDSCKQAIIISSDIPPTLNCFSDITLTSEDGNPVTTEIKFASTTTFCDQEINLSFTRSDFLGVQEAFPIGTTTITWTVLDESGNQSECTQLITVISNDSSQSSENDITSFLISGQLGESRIDQKNSAISFVVPFGTNVTALSPNIEISENATISPETDEVQDFTSPLMYTVTSEDGTEQMWTVTAIIEEEELDDLVSITGFVLVNADTNEDLFQLEDGMRIDISDLPTLNLDIRANATDDVESVRLSLNGAMAVTRTENVAPYALYGDSPAGNYNGNDFALGNYTVSALPYQEDNLQGITGELMQISFEFYQEVSEPIVEVTEFVLVNADTNEDILILTEGMQININSLPTLNLDVRANASSTVESVKIELTGDQIVARTENLAPYALFGDLPAGNYNGNSFTEGNYVISAVPYSEDNLKGDAGEEFQINFELYADETVATILQFTLVNADTNEDLFVLTEGMQIDMNSLSTQNLDIRADASESVKSVSLSLSGTQSAYRTENVAPYAMFGDFPTNNYLGNLFTTGNYSIVATGYSEEKLVGEKGEPLSVNFKILGGVLTAQKANIMEVYPNPASSVITLEFEAPEILEVIYVYDVLGREVDSFNGTDIEQNGTYVLNLESFPEGQFYIKSYTKNRSYLKQLMIKK